MKIELEVTHTTKTEYDIEFPYYLKDANNLCFCKYLETRRTIKVDLYDFGFGLDYTEHLPLESQINRMVLSNEVEFNEALNNVKLKLEGILNEVHKADEQQKGS